MDSLLDAAQAEIATLKSERTSLKREERQIAQQLVAKNEQIKRLTDVVKMLNGKKVPAGNGRVRSARGENLKRVEEALRKRRQATTAEIRMDTGLPSHTVRNEIDKMRSNGRVIIKGVNPENAQHKVYEIVEGLDQRPAEPAQNGEAQEQEVYT